MDKEGGYVTRPPLLGDSNYDIWKARMIAFLKSMDSKTWKAVLKGWEHPKVKHANGADTDELKPEEEWTAAEDSLALGNSKALNALFNGVDKNMFRLIKKCEVAKDAWEILKTTQEGTAKVKISRLQNLTRKFENLRMKEDESVHNFYMNVMDFANSFDDLGEKLSDEKIVRKILRSLTKKFDMKVIAMEEAQDISTMKVDELIGSLQTYESSVNERIEKKNKSIAFVSNTKDEDLESDMESTDSVSEAIVLLGRQFNKVLKRMDRRPRKNARHLATDMSRSIGNSRKTKIDEKPAQSKGIQCHECEGYGHIRTECATYLKKQKKKVSYDELAETYKDLCLVSEEKCKELEKQKKLNSQLQGEKNSLLSKIDDLQKKVNSLTSDLNAANVEIDKLEVDIGRLRKYSEMLNKTGADKLGEILEKNVRRPKFTGISDENVNKHRSYNPELMYTQPKESPMSRKMLQHSKQHHGVRTLQESARAMLHAKKLPYSFWDEAMNTACYIHNKVTLRSGTTTTLYELWKNKKPTVKYFHVFGSKCHILADREQRRKLDPKSDEGIFLGYSSNSRAYRVYNSRTKVIMESSNVVVDDSAEERSTNVADDVIASDIQSNEPDIVEEVENSIESSKPDPTSIDPTNDPPKKGPSIKADVPKRMESDLSLDYRLFEGTHAADIVAPVAAHNARQPTNIPTRDQIIVDLKKVSSILGEKKGMVDLVVHTLEFEKIAAACAGIEGTSSVIPHVTEDDTDDVGGDTGVEEEHSDASPLVCSA
ncbi:hypothetical protein TSUD_371830 [Trifolium subterraneum]|uniref:Retroviral polymerase SH3-like domain-containing protein n=1 Tax=Trifolium subterraneum TaxID=3900 RepID=A0A2Z6NQA7_TRISU|nr:hypothetical protein TSUD_371830 [Trifolium subterraneum]